MARRPEPRAIRRLAASAAGDGATGLALASVLDAVLALSFTIVFARVLGAGEYSSLAALVSIFLIVSIAGSALQVTIARRVSSEGARRDWSLGGSVEAWTRAIVMAAALLLLACAPARQVLADALGVDEAWAAALVLPAAVLDLALAVQRGVLLGLGAYRTVAASIVGAPAGWLVLGGSFAALGLGVGGVVGGIALAELLNAAALRLVLRRRLGAAERRGSSLPLQAIARASWTPMLALTLFAALQNLDVVVVNRAVDDEAAASSYAAAAVAAKAVLWVAIGVGLYLVPEAARRHAAGEHTGPLLGRAIAVVLAVALPALFVYAAAGEPLLGAVFGDDLALGAEALPVLAIAMTLLACAYLAVQMLLAHGRHRFLALLAVAAAIQPVALALAAPELTSIATAQVALAAAAAAALVAAALRSARARERALPAEGVA